MEMLGHKQRQPTWSPTRIALPLFLLVLVGAGALSAYEPTLSLALAVGWPLGLGLILWPEVTMGLYLNAGFFKGDPRLGSLSRLVDLTVALGVVLAAALAYRLILRRERIIWSREMNVALVFAGVILMGLVYTPAGFYAIDKARRFVLLTMLAFFTPLVVVKSRRSIWLFFLGWLGFAAWLAVGALGQLGTSQRLLGISGTSIGMSRVVGVAVIILLFAVLMKRGPRLWQILAAVALVPMMLALAGSGSRGPLLMLVVAVLFTFGFAIARPGYRMRALLIVGIVGLVASGVLASGLIPKTSLERFDTLMNETDADTSAQARLMVMEVAWRLFTSSPVFGYGTGSVSTFGAGQEQVYPHNILLELAAETGLVGLSLYLTVVGMVLWRVLSSLSRRAGHSPLLLALLGILLFTLLNAMVSGDLSDNRDMWLFAGVAIAATRVEGDTSA